MLAKPLAEMPVRGKPEQYNAELSFLSVYKCWALKCPEEYENIGDTNSSSVRNQEMSFHRRACLE